jgi:hypothetical protein
MQLETKNAKRTGPGAIVPGFPRSSRQSPNWQNHGVWDRQSMAYAL